MTTPIPQEHTPEAAARPPIKPVEEHDQSGAEQQQREQEQLLPPITVPRHPSGTPAGEGTAQPVSGFAKSAGHWIHQHRDLPRRGVGFLGYQYIRSAIASIPYGLSMAGTLALFTKMERVGEAMAKKPEASSVAQRFGRGLNGFAKFPGARWAALIGTSFTFYRGTSKLGKWMTEYLFNPKDSEERTAQKVDDLFPEAIRKIKEIAPAESNSTPISAIVLGFFVTAFQKPTEIAQHGIDWTAKHFKSVEGWGNKFRLMGKAITHPSAKFIPQAVINTFGYALFFEFGDRLFKDVQIRRGVWSGEHNSIKSLKAEPDEYEQGIKGGQGHDTRKYEDSAVEAVPEKSHFPFFTSEPGLGRFLFRRVLPTAIGITAYTAVKMRWASMLGNNFNYEKGITLKEFGKKAFGEGAATSLFFLIPVVAEPWEKMYDKFFARKDKEANAREHAESGITAKPLTPHQQQKYDELLARVNAKEAANDGHIAQRA